MTISARTALLALAAMAAPAGALADKDKAYTLADLKTLVAQKAYQEAISHLGDVPPAERKAEWLDVAAGAAAGFLAGTESEQVVYAIGELDRLYPQILASPKYTKVRAELGLAAYAKCLGGDGSCLAQGARFLDNDASNGELAMKFGKLVVRAFSSKYTAAPYFRRAVTAKAPGACKDGELASSLLAALATPKDHDSAVAGRAIVDACWAEQRAAVMDAFRDAVDNDSRYVIVNVCEAVKAKQVLGADQKRICARGRATD